MDKLKVLGIIFLTFVVSFFITTAVTDEIAKTSGFYVEGQAASDSWK